MDVVIRRVLIVPVLLLAISLGCERSATILFVGDTLTSRVERDGVIAVAPPVQQLLELRSHDHVVANLETAISLEEGHGGRLPKFIVPREEVALLAEWGINTVSVANNHSTDSGLDSFRDGVDALRANGISVVGFRRKPWEKLQIGKESVILFAATFHHSRNPPVGAYEVDANNVQGFIDAVATAGVQNGGPLVVYVHWGEEGSAKPTMQMRRVASALVEAGADAVVGHGSHKPAKVIRMGDSIIAWNLGDFAMIPGRQDGCVLSLEIRRNQLRINPERTNCEVED